MGEKFHFQAKGMPLIKFQDADKIKSLQSGKIYAKTLGYYRKREETGDCEVGDKYEGMIHINEATIYCPDTGEVIDPGADPCEDLCHLARFQRERCRCEEIISGRACCGTLRKSDPIVDFPDHFFCILRVFPLPVFFKLLKAYFFKFCDSLHDVSSS